MAMIRREAKLGETGEECDGVKKKTPAKTMTVKNMTQKTTPLKLSKALEEENNGGKTVIFLVFVYLNWCTATAFAFALCC